MLFKLCTVLFGFIAMYFAGKIAYWCIHQGSSSAFETGMAIYFSLPFLAMWLLIWIREGK